MITSSSRLVTLICDMGANHHGRADYNASRAMHSGPSVTMDPALIQYTLLAGIDPSELVNLLGHQGRRSEPCGAQMSDAQLARHLQLEQYREWLTLQIIAAGGDPQAEGQLSMLFEAPKQVELPRAMAHP